MRRICIATVAAVAALFDVEPPSFSQQPPAAGPGGEAPAVTKAILEEIDKHSELMTNIEYLCDMIGHRLTGSPGLAKANHWTRDKFRQYGLSNAHLEPWTIGRSWTRGDAKGRIVAPTEQRILVESSGWGPSTDGPVRGSVVHLKAESTDELTPYKGRLKGAWVILAEVSVQPVPNRPAPSLEKQYARRMRDYMRLRDFRRELQKFLAAEGIAGMLRDSNKEHGLMDMTTAVANLHDRPLSRGVPHHRVVRPDLAAAEARAGRSRDRAEEPDQRRAGRGVQHGRRDPGRREAR